MASSAAVKAGQAFVEVTTVGDIARQIGKQRRAVLRAVRGIAAGVAAIGLAKFFTDAVKGAVDLQETLNRFNAVFKENAREAEEFADTLSEGLDGFKPLILDTLATFQGLLVGMGVGAKEASNFSKKVTQVGFDLASFENIRPEEAFQRLRSALSGSSEVLDQFGINIRVAALKTKGITTASTEAEKAIARLELIMDAMTSKGALGDAARTAGSAANQIGSLGAAVAKIQGDIGKELLPFVQDSLPGLIEGAKAIGEAMAALVTGLDDSLGPAGELAAFFGEMGEDIAGSIRLIQALPDILLASGVTPLADDAGQPLSQAEEGRIRGEAAVRAKKTIDPGNRLALRELGLDLTARGRARERAQRALLERQRAEQKQALLELEELNKEERAGIPLNEQQAGVQRLERLLEESRDAAKRFGGDPQGDKALRDEIKRQTTLAEDRNELIRKLGFMTVKMVNF